MLWTLIVVVHGVVSTARPAVTAPSAEGALARTALAAGTLSITVSSATDLGAGFPGASLSGQLGSVRVSDTRVELNTVWTATVTATDFTTPGGGPARTISNSRMSYWSGPATLTLGLGTRVSGQPTSAQAQSLDVPRTAFAKTSGSGINDTTWQPTLVMAIPATAVGGMYHGTVTHSVA
jgi:hypothetical protein